MNIGVIGASGKAGRLIVHEALKRGHHVTGIARNAGKVNENIDVIEKNVLELKAEDLQPYEVVVNAFGAKPGDEHLHVEAGRVLIEALKGAPETRLIVVGGAGSLFVDADQTARVMDTPDFPEQFFATASSQGKNLDDLQHAGGIRWTFISPSAFFDAEGARTGSYESGKDQLLVNSSGASYISYADYAIAVLDEIEQAKHLNERFTVVGESN